MAGSDFLRKNKNQHVIKNIKSKKTEKDIDLIFITLFIYTLKQHSHFGNLRIDYANRKTLAQCYQHIVESGEHNEIREGFLKKAAEIFSSKAKMHSSDITLSEAVLGKLFRPRQEK